MSRSATERLMSVTVYASCFWRHLLQTLMLHRSLRLRLETHTCASYKTRWLPADVNATYARALLRLEKGPSP